MENASIAANLAAWGGKGGANLLSVRNSYTLF